MMMGDSTKHDEPPRGRSPKRKGRGEKASSLGRMIAYSHVAYVFIAAFGVPTAVGIWIDSESARATSPWGTILGVTLGLILSTIVAYREVRTTGKKLSTPNKPKQQQQQAKGNDDDEAQDES